MHALIVLKGAPHFNPDVIRGGEVEGEKCTFFFYRLGISFSELMRQQEVSSPEQFEITGMYSKNVGKSVESCRGLDPNMEPVYLGRGC